jgi:hypothetical protein
MAKPMMVIKPSKSNKSNKSNTTNKTNTSSGTLFGGKNPILMMCEYSSFTLKIIAMFMLAIGTTGISILQNGIMKLGDFSLKTLVEAVQNYGSNFWLMAGWLFSIAIMAVSLPIFAYFLIEGYKHTSSVAKYGLRLLLLALISEVPFDIAMHQSWFTMKSQNPVWGVLIGLVLIYFFEYFKKVGKVGVLLKLVVILAGLIWAFMLNISYGPAMVLLVAIFWLLDGHRVLSTILGFLVSVFHFPAPFGMLFNYWCNGKKGEGDRRIFYILYPLQLLVFGLIGKYLF